jgi:hypothetical protein
MAFQMTMGMTYDGREPEVLSDLILRRQRLFGETAQQAVIGTAIGVMQSLRTQTIVADENKFEFELSASAIVRWVTEAKRRKLVVEGFEKNLKFINLGGIHTTGSTYYVFTAKVYKQGNPEKLYILAKNQTEVAAYLKRRIKKYKGMARSAWGHLMRMTSQYAPTNDPITDAATNTLRKNLSVVSGGNQYDFAIQVTDDLQYAGAALKGGPASVTHALQAQSNKIAGRIRKFCADHPTFAGENIQTPFPEIAKRK